MSSEFSGTDNFFFVKAKKGYYEKPVGRPGENYVTPKVDYEKRVEDEDWASKEFETQVSDTASFLSKKELKIEDEVFYVLSSSVLPNNPDIEKSLTKLSANVLSYLDSTHNRLLVHGKKEDLTNLIEQKIPKYLESTFHMLRPLNLNDHFDSALQNWQEGKKFVIITTLPNLTKEKTRQYLLEIKNFLINQGSRVSNYEFLDELFVIANVEFSILIKLIESSTFVYKVFSLPEAITKKNPISKKSSVKPTIAEPSLFRFPKYDVNKLPIVTVLDTGVSKIPQLNNLIVSRSSFINDDLDDEETGDGHGTPISYLVSLGEEHGNPTARIISHKIWSPAITEQSFEGMMDGLNRFSNISKIFVSSINFKEPLDDVLLTELNTKIQENNVCFISSAGNLPEIDTATLIQKNQQHQSYFQNYPVSSPSDAPTITSVGAIAKKVTNHGSIRSVVNVNDISPFSRCNFKNRPLFDCKKPEVVEHGGNVNLDTATGSLSTSGVGVTSVSKNGNIVENLTGTSFAAPIFARKVAGIWTKYRTKIKNAETLKAISIISSIKYSEHCSGYGEPQLIMGCDHNHALYFAEGEIKLEERKGRTIGITYHTIDFKVPDSVGFFDVCIVHSDNFKKTSVPSLNTYVRGDVNNWSTKSFLKSKIGDRDAKTNVKILRFSYNRKSMKNVWTLRITPKIIMNMMPSLQKDITVRYGCAILLSRKSTKSSVYSISNDISNMELSKDND